MTTSRPIRSHGIRRTRYEARPPRGLHPSVHFPPLHEGPRFARPPRPEPVDPARAARIEEIRREIAAGTYLTPEKLEGAADALCRALARE
ncbi:MAG: flagellar biosynthesis anti-sigma factor FlgM [Planctomycetales bacterium]|nr:flagellar biosynthesis anti-sigma factor FlgM [Planctomycetales bacterium]